jgi:predicted CopG family antitoxin
MPSTTIKLEEDLHAKVGELKAPHQSMTAFVRELIEREHSRKQQAVAAEAYRAFLEEHPQERAELELWEAAPLSDLPSNRGVSS